MNKTRVIDSILLIVLLIGVSTFPVNLLVKDLFWYYVVEALLMLAVFLFFLFYESRNPDLIPQRGRFNLTNLLWLIPSLIAVFSNFIYALICKESIQQTFGLYSIPHAFFILFDVIVEEYVFRKYLLGNLNHPKKIIRILISASIFALCHLTIFFSTFNPLDLVVVAYAFGLGMVLGLIYCYTNSLISCIVYHFLFNFVNDFLFEHLFFVTNELWYYLINIFIALIVGIYLLFIYLLKLRKNPAKPGFDA